MRKLLSCLLPALLLMAGCEGTGTDTAADEGIATVNGEAISQEQLDSYAERRTGSDPATLEPEIRAQLLNELINIELLAQAAEAGKLQEKSPLKEQLEFQQQTAMADAAMTQYLEKNPVNDEAVRAEYEKRQGELGGKEYKARHILVEDEETARKLIADLDGGADFVELAKQNSVEPGADQSGGDLGWFSPSQMVPPFAAAVIAMQPGERSKDPVQTQFGWHVISVEDSRDVPPPAFESVAPQIERFLTNQRIQDYINELRGKAKITQPETATAPAAEPQDGAGEQNGADEPATETTPENAGDEAQPEA